MEKDKAKHLNRKVAISVALLSTFMAVSKVKDDNLVQAMLQAKTDAVDTWNEYQSKKLKHHLAATAISQDEVLRVIVPKSSAGILDAQIAAYRADITRYQREEPELMAKAKEFESRYDQMNFRDDQFDLSDACLSVSLMLLAVTALTLESWLLWGSWGLSGLGMVFGLAGFLGWSIHPDWLIRLLT